MIPEVFASHEIYNGELLGLWCKGHVTLSEFLAGIEKSFGTDYDKAIQGKEAVCHSYYRKVPFLLDDEWIQILLPSEKGRGAFKATYLDI